MGQCHRSDCHVLQNLEADDLTNGVFNSFDKSLRVQAEPSDAKFLMLNEARQAAADYETQLQEQKAAKWTPRTTTVAGAPPREASAVEGGPSKGKRVRLNGREPWC